MASCSSTTTADDGEGTSNTDIKIHQDIFQTHILTRLDGPTLFSFICVSSQLHSICTEESLWKSLCNSNWPSTKDPLLEEIISTFPLGYRSFLYDSYPTITSHHMVSYCHNPESKRSDQLKQEFISAVDIRYGNGIIYSKVAVSMIRINQFTPTPLRLDILDSGETVPTSLSYDNNDVDKDIEKNMRLSWILLDPLKKRAINLSSRKPMVARHYKSNQEIFILYATVIPAAGVVGGFVRCGVHVICQRKDEGVLHFTDIAMQMEDIEGYVLSGDDSFGCLQDAMEGKRVKVVQDLEEKKMYEIFMWWREYNTSDQFV